MLDCKQPNIASGATPIGSAGRAPNKKPARCVDSVRGVDPVCCIDSVRCIDSWLPTPNTT